jgi:hypothetical protein
MYDWNEYAFGDSMPPEIDREQIRAEVMAEMYGYDEEDEDEDE